ncbi:hypothetical protein VTK26DRAFT_9339 [Humicola hyalothermophila]
MKRKYYTAIRQQLSCYPGLHVVDLSFTSSDLKLPDLAVVGLSSTLFVDLVPRLEDAERLDAMHPSRYPSRSLNEPAPVEDIDVLYTVPAKKSKKKVLVP